MSNTRANGRNPRQSGSERIPIQFGKPARGIRDQRRAYEYQQQRAVEGNWADAREFEER